MHMSEQRLMESGVVVEVTRGWPIGSRVFGVEVEVV